MKILNIESAIKRYNCIMEVVGYEHRTINTNFSENTEGWNIRDMVAECDYILSCYFENGNCRSEMRYSDDLEERKIWKSETGKLKRFIEAYKSFIGELKCVSGHCSQYDNK